MASRAAAIAYLVHTAAFLVPRPPTQRCSLRASVDARDASGETPLIKAAEAGDCDAVASLLQQGADAMAEHMRLSAERTRRRLMAVSVFPQPELPGYLIRESN